MSAGWMRVPLDWARAGVACFVAVLWPSPPMRLVNRWLERGRSSSSLHDALDRRDEAQCRGADSPPRSMLRRCRVESEPWDGLPVFTVTDRRRSVPARTVIFLHGGGFTTPLQAHQWVLIAGLARSGDARVVVPTFTLAPAGSHQEALDRMLGVYRQVLETSRPGDVVLAGDSSGGGMAYTLAQAIRDRCLDAPARLLLFSPWLDLGLENPEIAHVEDKDPILDVPVLRHLGREWSVHGDIDDAGANPIRGGITGLPPVDVFIGTHEVFVADCRRLGEMAREADADVRVHEYRGGFHTFMYLRWLPETWHVMRVVRRRLRRLPKQAPTTG